MKGVLSITFLFCCFLLLLDSSTSLPLCLDSKRPFTLNTTLGLFPYNGSTCCNSTEDARIQKQFQLMNVPDHGYSLHFEINTLGEMRPFFSGPIYSSIHSQISSCALQFCDSSKFFSVKGSSEGLLL